MEHWNLAASLHERRQDKLYRERLQVDSAQGPELCVDGASLLAFSSNDYLGLANHPKVLEAFRTGLQQYGAGAGASHLVCGHQAPHHELELALAKFTGRERALLFPSGYQANLGIITALLGKRDQLFHDRLNHASLLDAGKLSGAKFRRYAHNDPSALRKLLNRAQGDRLMVATDGVFSMDGDLAPLPQLVAHCKEHGACLLVDDAHGIGVLGETGAGTLEHFGLDDTDVPIVMGTLGKSLGLSGAFVAGSNEIIESLVQSARSYIYTTALPPAIAAATQASLRLIADNQGPRCRLQNNITRFRTGVAQLGLPLADSITAIQPLILGESRLALAWSEQLRVRGFLVPAIRPPTVPAGTARLRIALSAAHTPEHIDRLLDTLTQIHSRLAA